MDVLQYKKLQKMKKYKKEVYESLQLASHVPGRATNSLLWH